MLIGIKNLYVAVMDDEENETYEAPFKIDNIREIGISPNTGVVDADGDNKVVISISYISEVEVKLSITEIPLFIQAKLLGQKMNDGMVIETTDDQPPYVALGYEATKENGSSVFVWYFKGKFMLPDENAATKGETPELQGDEITGTFSGTKSDLSYKKFADSDSPSYVDVSGTWFDSVLTGTGESTTPFVLMSEPFDGETGVPITQTITLIFNEEMDEATITNTDITLAAGTAVNCTVELGSDNKTVTITPNSNLASATEHTLSLAVAVTDVAGNAIVETDIVFTTA